MLQCPRCGENFFVPDALANNSVPCPSCNHALMPGDGAPKARETSLPGPAIVSILSTEPAGEVVFLPVDDSDPEPFFHPVDSAAVQPLFRGPRRRAGSDTAEALPATGYDTAASTAGISRGLAIASLGVALLSVCVSPVPPPGLFSLPFAAGGLLLGGAALVISLTRGGKGIWMPVIGVGVNGLAVGFAVLMHQALAAPPPGVVTRPELDPVQGATPEAKQAAEPGLQPTTPARPTPTELLAKHREGLKSDAASTRRAAAVALKDLGSAAAPAVPDLAAALRDSDAEVRAAAAEALLSLNRQAGSAYASLVRAASDPDGRVRSVAERFLNAFGVPPADSVADLVALSGDGNLPAETRVRALVALAKVGPKSESVVPALLTSLKSPDEPVRSQAIRALGASGQARDRAVYPKLLDALADPKEGVRAAAAEVVKQAGPPGQDNLPALEDALKSESGQIRILALQSLGGMGKDGRASATSVSVALQDRDPAVRISAVECLSRIAPQQTDELAKLLTDRDKEVRKAVVAKLRDALPPTQLFEALTDVLAATDSASRKDAAAALDQVDLPSDISVATRTKVRLSSALADDSPFVRAKAGKALQRLGWASDDLTPVLASLLTEDGDGVSSDAAATLAKIGASATRRVADDLVRALRAKDPSTRRYAAAALRSAGPLKPKAMPALIEALADGRLHEDVPALIAEFKEAAVADLVGALTSKSAATRKGAARALGLIGPKAADAYRPLTTCFQKDSDEGVRQEAGRAMDSIRRKP
jgi:HEAT repeat protein